MLNGLDLFSGIGGAALALAGYVRPVAYCENDRACQSKLLTRMASRSIPDAPIWDNVETLTGRALPPPYRCRNRNHQRRIPMSGDQPGRRRGRFG